MPGEGKNFPQKRLKAQRIGCGSQILNVCLMIEQCICKKRGQ